MWKSTGKFEGKNVIGLQYFFLFKGCKRKKNAQTEIHAKHQLLNTWNFEQGCLQHCLQVYKQNLHDYQIFKLIWCFKTKQKICTGFNKFFLQLVLGFSFSKMCTNFPEQLLQKQICLIDNIIKSAKLLLRV